MARAVDPVRKPATPRNQKTLRQPTPSRRPVKRAPAATPRPTQEQRARAFVAAHDAALLRTWGGPGQLLTTVGDAELWSAARATPTPHWHLVSRGLWTSGFELSLKVVHAKDEVAPPAWAVALLERQVLRAADEGAATPDETCCVVEPSALSPGSELAALAFTPDPLGPIVTPYAQVPTWQVVPLTRDEERVVREWSPSGLVEVLRAVDPHLVAHPERPSLLSSPRARQLIEQRVAREGSSLSSMRARVSSLNRAKGAATWKLSSDGVETFIALLKGRTAHQRPFIVRGTGAPLEVRPGDCAAVEPADEGAVLKLSQAASRQLRAVLKAKPGRYALEALPGFTLEVV
jgi:hypothetical protein